MRKRQLTTVVTVASAALWICAPAQSQAVENWDFKLAPYLWTSGITGDLGPSQAPASVNMDFSDLVSMVDAGFAMFGEAQYKEKCTVMADFFWIDMSQDGTAPSGTRIDVENEQILFTVAGAYRVSDNIDLYGGARWISLDTKLKAAGASLGESKEEWVDPIVGLRMFGSVSEKVTLSLTSDVGGFGVNSELTWHFLGNVRYAFNDTWSGLIGYRVLDVDYDEGGFVADFIMSGLQFGVGAAF